LVGRGICGRSDADPYTQCDPHSDSDADRHANAKAFANAVTDSVSDSASDSDSKPNRDTFANTNGITDADAASDSNADADANADRDTFAHRNAITVADSNSVRHAHSDAAGDRRHDAAQRQSRRLLSRDAGAERRDAALSCLRQRGRVAARARAQHLQRRD